MQRALGRARSRAALGTGRWAAGRRLREQADERLPSPGGGAGAASDDHNGEQAEQRARHVQLTRRTRRAWPAGSSAGSTQPADADLDAAAAGRTRSRARACSGAARAARRESAPARARARERGIAGHGAGVGRLLGGARPRAIERTVAPQTSGHARIRKRFRLSRCVDVRALVQHHRAHLVGACTRAARARR